MPRPSLRTHSQARKNLKTPGNKNTIHYTRRKPKISHCAICKNPLPSVPRLRPAKVRKTRKVDRRPNRLESGRYCTRCLKNLLRESIWNQ
jgi:large subunit ribosomal protein L34e